MAIPQDQNLRWSLDFVMDTLVSGRRFRILTVVDDFTGMPHPGGGDLAQRASVEPVPDVLRHRVHASNTILAWQQDRDVEWHYIAPGKRMQNGFVESFNGRVAQISAVGRCLTGVKAGEASACSPPHSIFETRRRMA
jgi:putative transposase